MKFTTIPESISEGTDSILQEYNIPHEPFSQSVLDCLPSQDYKVELLEQQQLEVEAEVEQQQQEEENGTLNENLNKRKRLDLRHLPVISIDPPGCQDIDNALHCIVPPLFLHLPSPGLHKVSIIGCTAMALRLNLSSATPPTPQA